MVGWPSVYTAGETSENPTEVNNKLLFGKKKHMTENKRSLRQRLEVYRPEGGVLRSEECIGPWNVEASLSWQLYPTLFRETLNVSIPLTTPKASHEIKVFYWRNAESGRLLIELPKFYFCVGKCNPNTVATRLTSRDMEWRFL